MTLLVFVAALAGGQGAFAGGKQLFAAGQAPTAQNIPGRDAAVVLSDLGKGKASLSTFITVGQTSQAVKMWTGPLPVSHAKLVAGDFNTDGYTDALVLVDAGKRRTNLMLFTSDGTQFTLSATWTSKAGQIVWASASMTSGRFTRAGTDCALVTCRLANGKTVIYAFEDVFGSLTGRCLYKSAGAGLAAKAQIACGDVNKDLSDEAVIFSPAAKGGSLHFYAYDGTGLNETTSTAVGGSTTGAQLACGDVNGDGRDEPLLLTRSGSSTTLTAYSVDGEAISSTRVPVSSPFAKNALLGAADMNGDGRSDPVAFAAVGKARGSFVVGLSGAAGVTARAAWSGAMRTAGARFACARTVSTIVKDNVRQLPGSLSSTIVSIAPDQSTIVFAGAPTAVTDLQPGDVLLMQPGGIAERGIFRIVDSVQPAVGGTAVSTSPADLQDLFAQAQIRMVLSPAPSYSARTAHNGDHPYSTTAFKIPYTLDWSAKLGDGGTLKLKGDMAIGAGLGAWYDVSWTHIWAGAYFNFYEYIHPPKSGHSVEFDIKKKLNNDEVETFDKTTLHFPVCGLDVWVDLDLAVDQYVTTSGSVDAWADFTQDFSFRVGAQYDGDGWTNLSKSPDPGYPNPNQLTCLDSHLGAKLSAQAGVRFQCSAMLLSLFGPRIGAGPYVRAQADSTNNPAWGVYFGLDAQVGFKIRWLMDKTFGTWTLVEKPLIEAPVDPSKPLTVWSAPITEVMTDTSGWIKPIDGAVALVQFHRTPNTDKPVLAGSLVTHYRIDGGAWTTCYNGVVGTAHSPGKPAILQARIPAGTHTLDFYSTLSQGGHLITEANRTVTVKVDVVPPSLQVPSSDWSLWHRSGAIAVSGTDTGGSGFDHLTSEVRGYVRPPGCVLPGWYPTMYAQSPTGGSLALLADGVYKMSCIAYDKAGNSSAPQTWFEKIDSHAPVTTVTGGDALWHATPVTLAFHAADPAAVTPGSAQYAAYKVVSLFGMNWWLPTMQAFSFTANSGVASTEYSLDGGKTWTKGTSVTIGTAGDNTVLYRSADAAGNVETAKQCHVKIGGGGGDTTPPVTTVSGADSLVHTSPVTLTFTATDEAGGSGVAYTEYSINAGAWVRGTSVIIGALGDNVVDYRSADIAGNVEATKECHVKIGSTDVTAPVTTCSPDPNAPDELTSFELDYGQPSWVERPDGLRITFSATDSESGVARTECRTQRRNAGVWSGWSAWSAGTSVLIEASWDKPCELEYRSVDNAGNVETTRYFVDIATECPWFWVLPPGE